jgi:hypothetical protein
MLLNYSRSIHGSLTRYWREEEERLAKAIRHIPTRFERIEMQLNKRTERQGDALIAKVKDMFHNGMGIVWGTDQGSREEIENAHTNVLSSDQSVQRLSRLLPTAHLRRLLGRRENASAGRMEAQPSLHVHAGQHGTS